MTSEMMPCPFCGGEAEISSHEIFGSAVICNTEGCAANLESHNSDAEAIAAWNTRPTPALSAADADEIVRLAKAWVDAGIRHRVAIYAHDLSGGYQALERELNAAQSAFEAKIKELRG